MPVTLQESLRGLVYAPYYAALALGAYRREGLAIDFVCAPAPADAPAGLFAGTVDVAWGGPMRVMQMYETRPDCDLVCFGEVVTRDPFLLIGRERHPDFILADLYGKRLATVSEVPTPWLCLQEDLRRAGLDPDALPRITDRTMADNAAALRQGEVDVVQLFEPFAEELITAGEGHLWYAAAARGPTAYTSFYMRRNVLASRRDEIKKLVRGLYRTQKWLHAQPPDALADAVQSFFPSVPPTLLRAAVARYLDAQPELSFIVRCDCCVRHFDRRGCPKCRTGRGTPIPAPFSRRGRSTPTAGQNGAAALIAVAHRIGRRGSSLPPSTQRFHVRPPARSGGLEHRLLEAEGINSV